MKKAVFLVNGLKPIGRAIKRSVLHVLAANCRIDGTVWLSDVYLRNSTELSQDALKSCLDELHKDGWIFREGYRYTLAIAKLEANQRNLVTEITPKLAVEIERCRQRNKTRLSSTRRTA